jgi:hypothetical protein
MIEIDHGNDLMTRYAHASKTLVKRGDLIKRSQKIAEVDSTGRSTGPHLHFEVWVQGIPQDPQKFLVAGNICCLNRWPVRMWLLPDEVQSMSCPLKDVCPVKGKIKNLVIVASSLP